VDEAMDCSIPSFIRTGYGLLYPIFPHYKRPTDEQQQERLHGARTRQKYGWLPGRNILGQNDYVANNRISIAITLAPVTAGGISCTFESYPNVQRWLGRMKKLQSWPKVNEGCTASRVIARKRFKLSVLQAKSHDFRTKVILGLAIMGWSVRLHQSDDLVARFSQSGRAHACRSPRYGTVRRQYRSRRRLNSRSCRPLRYSRHDGRPASDGAVESALFPSDLLGITAPPSFYGVPYDSMVDDPATAADGPYFHAAFRPALGSIATTRGIFAIQPGGRISTTGCTPIQAFRGELWPGADSNHRHTDFELPLGCPGADQNFRHRLVGDFVAIAMDARRSNLQVIENMAPRVRTPDPGSDTFSDRW
jgi:hypothetical protein